MSTSRPPFADRGLQSYLQACPLPLPLPPGPHTEWTCAWNLFGAIGLLARDDRGMSEMLDQDMLREILRGLGRPTRKEEQRALLLVTPIEGGTSRTSALRPLLHHSSYWARQRSALLAGRLGCTELLPDLVRNLRDSDNDARRGAAEGLGRMGDPAAIEPLARGPWEDSDESVDFARCAALARLDDWNATAPILDEHKGEGAGYELACLMAMAHRTNDPAALMEWLETRPEDGAVPVGLFLSLHPSLAVTVTEELSEVLAQLDDVDHAIPLARALGGAGEDAVDAIEELMEHESWQVRQAACIAAQHQAESGAALADALEKCLADSDPDVRREAMLACTLLGIDPETHRPGWERDLTSAYRFLSRLTEMCESHPALGRIAQLTGQRPPTFDLLELLEPGGSSMSEEARGLLLLALAQAAPDMLWATFDALARDDGRDQPTTVRRWAAAALLLTGHAPTKMGTVHRILLAHEGEVHSQPTGSMQGLAERVGELACIAIQDGDWPVRLDALRLLSRLGEAMEPYREMIAHSALHDGDSDCRQLAQAIIGTSWRSRTPETMVADLYVRARSSEHTPRVQALQTLFSEHPTLGGPLLAASARSEQRELARAAARMLGSATTESTLATRIGQGLAQIGDSSWIRRESAVDLLGALPVELLDDAMLDTICERLTTVLSEDDDSDVQGAAHHALTNLGRPPAGDAPESEDIPF